MPKKVGSVHTAKNGAKYKILPNGKARFISGPTSGPGSKKKAGSMAVGGSVRVAGGLRKKKRKY